MTESDVHPLVREYMKRFDEAALAVPEPRRSMLREEIIAHLRDTISSGMSDSAAAVAIANLGSPVEILGEDAQPAPTTGPYRGHSDGVKIVLLGLAIVLGAGGVTVLLPSIVSYLTAPGLIFSPFVWTLGLGLIIASALLTLGYRHRAKRHSRGTS
jgi:hypothetical protein